MNRDNETSHLFQLLQRVNSLYERDASPAEVEAFRERTRAVWELALDRPQMRRPKVFVGTPYHTSIHPDTIAATKQWATDDNLEVVVGRVCSSLLANGCNQLVVEALKAKADLFCLLVPPLQRLPHQGEHGVVPDEIPPRFPVPVAAQDTLPIEVEPVLALTQHDLVHHILPGFFHESLPSQVLHLRPCLVALRCEPQRLLAQFLVGLA